MMKYAIILFAFAALGLAGEKHLAGRKLISAEKSNVPDCFKVNSLLRADEEHYWAAWTNACSYTIDSVYVMVKFADDANKLVGNGVWGLHFITPGASRVTRFSTPARLADYRFVRVGKITTNSDEALHPPGFVGDPGPRASAAPAVNADKPVILNASTGPVRLIADPGPLVYQLGMANPSFEKTALVDVDKSVCPASVQLLTQGAATEGFGCRVGK